MQAENLAVSAALPKLMAMLFPPRAALLLSGDEPEPMSLCMALVALVLAAVVLEVVIGTCATDGDVDPPHPEASNESPVTTPTSSEQRTKTSIA